MFWLLVIFLHQQDTSEGCGRDLVDTRLSVVTARLRPPQGVCSIFKPKVRDEGFERGVGLIE